MKDRKDSNQSVSCIRTAYGDLYPNVSFDEPRKKYRESITYYKSGTLKSVYLEKKTQIKTAIGPVSTELVTFYENGSIKRLFPLYGQINGYWTEEDEYRLAEEISIPVLGKNIHCKPLCLHFYESGALKSVTLWRQMPVLVPTLQGDIVTKFGFSLTESGRLETIEPAFGTRIQTPYGIVKAYDSRHNLLHADHNSLGFDYDGNILFAKTIENRVRILQEEQVIKEFAPILEKDFENEELLVRRPMTVRFEDGNVVVDLGNGEQTVWNPGNYRIEII